jgi:antitoxin (DNA-binding transcriptional repressor) of toxin-antitoxin stability system
VTNRPLSRGTVDGGNRDLPWGGDLAAASDAESRSAEAIVTRLSHRCYAAGVPKEITQRQLRNESGAVMRALDSGESFVVTRNGVAVGELKPVQRHRFVPREAVREAFARAAQVESRRFRADLDRVVHQDPTPRA